MMGAGGLNPIKARRNGSESSEQAERSLAIFDKNFMDRAVGRRGGRGSSLKKERIKVKVTHLTLEFCSPGLIYENASFGKVSVSIYSTDRKILGLRKYLGSRSSFASRWYSTYTCIKMDTGWPQLLKINILLTLSLNTFCFAFLRIPPAADGP
jgi:hypothetical protein